MRTHKTLKRRRKNRRSVAGSITRHRKQKGGITCPEGYSPRMCEKYIQKWKIKIVKVKIVVQKQ